MDITLCIDSHCPSRDKCLRATATPDPLWQAYADFNRDPEQPICEHFEPNEKEIKP